MECKSCGLCIDEIELFSDLNRVLKERVASLASHEEVNRNELLIREGEGLHRIIIIREGRVKLSSYDKDGKEYILDILVPGNILGEENLFLDSLSPYNGKALTRVKYCSIKKKDMLKIVEENPDFSLAIIKGLSKKLEIANDKIKNLMDDDALRKICIFLLQRSDRLNSLEIPLGVEDIALSINLRRETVSRKLNILIDEGLLIRGGQKYLRINSKENLIKKIL